MRRSAFTLVELLVTVAIIAILVAILLPSLAAARKTGRLTAGATNLRSCGQIMLTYTNDNKGDFLNPFRKSWPETAGGGDLKWWDVVSPTDSSMYWSMKGTPSFHTDRFMYVWYSYLAAYRGGGRMAAEMFSPADPYA
ncbi:MAG: type II secretion system protein, partial [Phycisphaerales bacterium]